MSKSTGTELRVVVVDADKREVREEVLQKPTLEAIQKVVEGKVDLIRDLIVHGVQVDTWVNDEFVFGEGNPAYIGPFQIKGNAVLACYDPNSGDTIELNERVSLDCIREIVHFPEVH